jgi:hypothetical protein
MVMSCPRLLLAGLLACGGCRSKSDPAPESVEVSVADVHLFVDAWRRLDAADSTCAPIADYLRHESRGLAAYRSKFGVGQRDLCLAIHRSPARYAALESKLPGLDSAGGQIKDLFAKFAALHAPRRLPAVYFVVGDGISVGTTTHEGHPMVLVGLELNRSTGSLPRVITHELVHTQQDFPFLGSMTGGPSLFRGSLLRQSITEGSADFLTELVTGTAVRNDFGETHEAMLWAAFQRDAGGKDYRRWLYNGRDSVARGDWPPDLGYWMGYRISKSYYENATDKRKAIAAMLTIRDFPAFLAASRYNGAVGANTP